DNAQLEALAAMYKEDVIANRPAAGTHVVLFYATDTGYLYYDNGSAWVVVGAKTIDASATSSATSTVPFTAIGQGGQSADLAEFKVAATLKASVAADGSFTGATLTGTNLVAVGTSAATVVLSGKAAASQSA